MEVTIKNFCLVKEAQLSIDSITVIGAENDTGKSTIGKVLFGVFNSLETYIDHYFNLSTEEIEKELKKVSLNGKERISLSFIKNTVAYTESKSTKNIKKREEVLELSLKLKETIRMKLYEDVNIDFGILDEFKTKFLLKNKNTFEKEEKESLLEKIEEIRELLRIINNSQTLFLHKLSVFYEKEVSKIIYNFKSKIKETEISVREKMYEISIKYDKKSESWSLSNSNLNKIKDVIYIESPLVLDFETYKENAFRKNLRRKLQNKQDEFLNFEGKETKEEVLSMINGVISGKLYFNSKEEKYKFKKGNEEIEMGGVASGIKSLGIISILLENNHLTKDTILIIDEPEVHLHPKWQIKYAEILCILAKKIGLKILVNSHSPYFIEAISVYSNSNKYNLNDSVKFYSYDIYEDGNILVDKTNDLVFIYNKLAEPYDILNNEKFGGRF